MHYTQRFSRNTELAQPGMLSTRCSLRFCNGGRRKTISSGEDFVVDLVLLGSVNSHVVGCNIRLTAENEIGFQALLKLAG
jgi:hypothetical protein